MKDSTTLARPQIAAVLLTVPINGANWTQFNAKDVAMDIFSVQEIAILKVTSHLEPTQVISQTLMTNAVTMVAAVILLTLFT